MAVGATLAAVQIQELHEIIGGGEDSVELVRHDLCAVLVPRFVDPDPVDLVFSDGLYVPFGSFRLLEPVK